MQGEPFRRGGPVFPHTQCLLGLRQGKIVVLQWAGLTGTRRFGVWEKRLKAWYQQRVRIWGGS